MRLSPGVVTGQSFIVAQNLMRASASFLFWAHGGRRVLHWPLAHSAFGSADERERRQSHSRGGAFYLREEERAYYGKERSRCLRKSRSLWAIDRSGM